MSLSLNTGNYSKREFRPQHMWWNTRWQLVKVGPKSHISYMIIIKLCFEELPEPFFLTMKIHQNKQNTNKQMCQIEKGTPVGTYQLSDPDKYQLLPRFPCVFQQHTLPRNQPKNNTHQQPIPTNSSIFFPRNFIRSSLKDMDFTRMRPPYLAKQCCKGIVDTRNVKPSKADGPQRENFRTKFGESHRDSHEQCKSLYLVGGFKNISQNGNLLQIGVKIKKWNHHLGMDYSDSGNRWDGHHIYIYIYITA